MNGQLIDGGRLHKSYSVAAAQCRVAIKHHVTNDRRQDLTHAAVGVLMARGRDKAALRAIRISNGLQIQLKFSSFLGCALISSHFLQTRVSKKFTQDKKEPFLMPFVP